MMSFWPLCSIWLHSQRPKKGIGAKHPPHVPIYYRVYVGAGTFLRAALTIGGVAHDVACEWLTLSIITTARRTPPHALTLLKSV